MKSHSVLPAGLLVFLFCHLPLVAQTTWSAGPGSSFFDASAGVSYTVTGTLRTAAPVLLPGTMPISYRHAIVDIGLTWNSAVHDEANFGGPAGGTFDLSISPFGFAQVQVIFGTSPIDDFNNSTRFTLTGPLNFVLGTAFAPTQIGLDQMFPFSISDALGNQMFAAGDRLSLFLEPETSVPEASTWAALAVISFAGLWQVRRQVRQA